MQKPSVRLLLGATLLVAGFGTLTEGSPVKNPVVRTVASVFDMQDRECRRANVAPGAFCPKGCEARPDRAPEDRSAPPKCHSALWVATCGDACAPAAGYARLPDGKLVYADRLSLSLDQAPDATLEKELSDLGVTLTPRFDGLFRYDALLRPPLMLEKTKKRLSALPGVHAVDYVLR